MSEPFNLSHLFHVYLCKASKIFEPKLELSEPTKTKCRKEDKAKGNCLLLSIEIGDQREVPWLFLCCL